MSTATWLRELGAVRPMAPAANTILVLGAWVEGHYPIQWCRPGELRQWDEAARCWKKIPPQEEWRLFGVPCAPLDRETCERIVKSIGV